MTLSPSTHWIAAIAFERMLYCLAEGTALAAVVAAALRLIPGKNARTRFAVWFAALAAVVLLPAIPMGMEAGKAMSRVLGGSPQPLLTLSSAWAEYIILAWAALAGLGLLRVAAGLWQIRRLRRGCVALDPRVLGPELEATIAEFSKRRPVSILVSSRLDVPTAIGFLRPAILVPAWLAEASQAEELKYVLLHELAHLERWDDWTNLAQKLVKAILFFHPGVWWIERKLSLDREMACDDAVLARTGSPRLYAQCLARVAEKSFLRRKIALAQAAVDRMRQLSRRVTRILDGNRPRSTRLWKPAIPMVAAIALLCAVSTSSTKNLVKVSDEQPGVAVSQPASATTTQRGGDQVMNRAAAAGRNMAPVLSMAKFTPIREQSHGQVTARQRSIASQSGRSPFVPARYHPPANLAGKNSQASRARKTNVEGSWEPDATMRSASIAVPDGKEVQQYGVLVLVVASERITSAGSMTWQVKMWELRLAAPANRPTKPVPRKT